jgi:hypothetical protein
MEDGTALGTPGGILTSNYEDARMKCACWNPLGEMDAESIFAQAFGSDHNMASPRAAVMDFAVYVFAPFAISTLAFILLIWLRDPLDFGEEWPLAFVASSVIGIFAFFGFVGRRSRIRFGIWRELL